MRRLGYIALAVLVLIPVVAALIGGGMGVSVLHPLHLNAMRMALADQVLADTHSTKEDFIVHATDGIELRGWKMRPPDPNGDWVILCHGVGDNRTGTLAYAEFLLRHGYSLVMMDSRAHGASGGDIATYGFKERDDTVAITDALYRTEKVRRLYAMGVSMGAALVLDSAAVEPRISAVVAEDPFASLREVSYDYAGLHFSPMLGKTLFRPATITGLRALSRAAGYDPDEISPERAVAARPFPVLLICGTRDVIIPCRHAELICKAAAGPKELWVVNGAEHASAMGVDPAEYEGRVIRFLGAH
jgi:alpha-beta hydrolase superfamily lysophospholipase